MGGVRVDLRPAPAATGTREAAALVELDPGRVELPFHVSGGRQHDARARAKRPADPPFDDQLVGFDLRLHVCASPDPEPAARVDGAAERAFDARGPFKGQQALEAGLLGDGDGLVSRTAFGNRGCG